MNMNALSVLYGGGLSEAAYEPVFAGKSALSLALKQGGAFPHTRKIILLLKEENPAYKPEYTGIQVVQSPCWTKKSLLETLAGLSSGFDLIYFAWADCPFLDPALAETVAKRHLKYAADYAYADGWPYGLAPETLSPALAATLAGIAKDDLGPVERDALFSVIQKDINAFDIETAIAPVDLRGRRLSLASDSKRNLLLLSRFAHAGVSGAASVQALIEEKPALLRTLPNFYAVQAAGPCPQACALCPYPRYAPEGAAFLDPGRFDALLDTITAFSHDGVVDLSLWGELSLHPEKERLIESVLSRPSLSLIIETSGIGWKTGELEELARKAAGYPARENRQAPLSWIVSLDTQDPKRYRELRGPGYAQAQEAAAALARLFPQDAYMQAVRVKGAEDDIELFYRFWKDAGAQVIIQKYDGFHGLLPDLRAADLSPIKRLPCWHLQRDMPVLLDGAVPACREDLERAMLLGNAFSEPLEAVWERGAALYQEHCNQEYAGICAGCDEYYTYNF
ncbi:MAG: spiro-SPASM protein [Spirochaetaceae bacterium]|jgi:spiro-SPASM protein|nr:spiro-SPASM protein [Spirochaetaceae bacterium]